MPRFLGPAVLSVFSFFALQVGERNVVEAATDWLRNDLVDQQRLLLPNDNELLREFQGQTYVNIKDSGDPYGRRRLFGGGSFHTLDAAKMAMCSIYLPSIEAKLSTPVNSGPVIDVFLGAYPEFA